MDGETRSVCFDNGFDNIAASLICKHLNISSQGYAMWLPRNVNFSIAVTDVHCNSSAMTPFDCDGRDYNATVHTCSGDAGVNCQGMSFCRLCIYLQFKVLKINFHL